jgi:predicted alpha/beta superfamily hydrolase
MEIDNWAGFIVVMTQGHALQGANVGPLVRLTGETDMYSKRFPQDLIQDIIPLVERNYRAYADADHRAIAGLSMGGGQAFSIGLVYPDPFHYILGFSAAVGGPFTNAEAEFKEALSKPDALNAKLRLLWVGCGKQDFLYQANRQFVDMLKNQGVKLLFRETEGSPMSGAFGAIIRTKWRPCCLWILAGRNERIRFCYGFEEIRFWQHWNR